MKEALRAQIEAAAREHGVSLNAEAAGRLEQSFTLQNHIVGVFGGRAAYNIALLMSANFHHVGAAAAGGREIAEWLKDPDVFEIAMRGAVNALWMAHPDPTPQRKREWIESLARGWLATQLNQNPWVEPKPKPDQERPE